MKLVKYNHLEFFKIWNDFVENSKNGTFLLNRNFMDYHSERYEDNSLLFFDDNELVAILPANLNNNCLYSHQGLTYGGIILSRHTKLLQILEIFNLIIKYCKEVGFEKFFYKTIPFIYHKYPSQEDLYALFKNNFKLFRRDISSTILLKNRIEFSKGKKSNISKAKKHQIEILQFNEFENFYELLSITLSKYNIKPVHSAGELELLSKKFPDNIKLIGAFLEKKLISATLVFENYKTIHLQYITSSEIGKNVGAFDFIVDYLVNDLYQNFDYLDFGISTENNGLLLNEGLLMQKELFGARGVCYDHYVLDF